MVGKGFEGGWVVGEGFLGFFRGWGKFFGGEEVQRRVGQVQRGAARGGAGAARDGVAGEVG